MDITATSKALKLDYGTYIQTIYLEHVSDFRILDGVYQLRYVKDIEQVFRIKYDDIESYNGGEPASFATLGTTLAGLIEDAYDMTLNTGDISLGAVEIKDGTTDTRQTVTTKGSVGAAASYLVDGSGTQITTFGGPATGDVAHDAADSGNPVKVGGKATAALPTAVTEGDRVQQSYDLYGQARVVPEVHSYIQATHFSPADGSVAFTSTSTLTASAFPFTVDISTCNIRSVMVTTQTYTSILYENGIDGINITSSSNVISVYQRGVLLTPFAATDLKYGVAIAYQNKGYNPTTDTNKVSEDSPNWMRYTSPETLIASSQTITGSAADLGYEIDCQGYKKLIAFITLDVNDSANVRIKALGKHTSAGTEEYEIPTKVVASTEVKVTPMYYELDNDADQLIMLDWDVTGIAYVQLQVWAGTAGTTGAITAAYATKMY